ncbi:type II secretion system F family protein [Spirilliplanes yamanashiensis]|uniref:Tight adherence protein B n=1 Tax=Spirilliplanes yamanashiensis TaxID=42233 RepID=A0A8J4DK56_9ACTN|nr:hypothetical protein [Spirilliplanes yamanashiensis]MDP9815451.1 tight adherence protein B [Spirilliplanes yamanashiensis]GIJ03705.1 hypothetical protein Sya03_30570 [Spirilliplanes yamanashiensis]
MTAEVVLAAAALVAGAVVVIWPARSRLPSAEGVPKMWSVLPRAAAWRRHPRWATLAAAVAGAAGGGLAAGPVLAAVAAGYAALAARAALRHARARAEAAARARALDTLGAVAAELRAGLPPAAVLPDPEDPTASGTGDDRFHHLTGAVWHLAEQTGAPAADLVERIEADARAADRARATAAAQGAGAQATAVLLAALPLGGIVLGYLIGADPLAVLLHTPIGAACALGALGLQTAGLAWSDRLARAGLP